jgi:hypothetical protein
MAAGCKVSMKLVDKKKLFSLPVKIQGDSNSFDIAESKYENQIALSRTNMKTEGIKFKKIHL